MKKLTAKIVLSAGVILSLVMGVGVISTSVHAKTVSCAQAELPSEFAVCNNENLLVKDEKLGALFDTALLEASGNGSITRLTAEHSIWLKRRNDCRIDFECLDKRYNERLDQLTSR